MEGILVKDTLGDVWLEDGGAAYGNKSEQMRDDVDRAGHT
jgi:hypothetical protein